MENIVISSSYGLRGEVFTPPDKSISHRALMFAAIAEGGSVIKNLLYAGDVLSTMNALRRLSVEIEDDGKEVRILGRGLRGIKEPNDVIDCGNSGTTTRLLAGILSGNKIFSVMTGDDSLRKRPMDRIIKPLSQMGAVIYARNDNKYLPMCIRGGNLKSIEYKLPVASAQVKSCLILASLYANGVGCIIEDLPTRDHTERMLQSMGVDLKRIGSRIEISPPQRLNPLEITVPGDFSSAAFFIAGALLVPNSELIIRDVLVNPTRAGLLDVLKGMGANVEVANIREKSGETVADIICRFSPNLKAVKIDKKMVPSMIDEFPILCVLATQCEGTTEIRGAEELRVKESDRINSITVELSKMGANIVEYPDGVDIIGKTDLKGTVVNSHKDHRIAMSLAIAGLIAAGKTTVNDIGCVSISFPSFFNTLKALQR
ncbi:MAG: 3-phosphoshikimate 1-carboxyvinyltransferase [Thermodesulfovibrionales bacterium]|nr:3-phosphoshikimate 1-carboxyvinyltransferase [Thermodesulfovibrionales bacterium]